MLEPRHVCYLVAHPGGHIADERDGILRAGRQLIQKRFQAPAEGFQPPVRLQIARHLGRVDEGEGVEAGIEEECERIDRRHVRDERDVDDKFGGFAWKYDAREVIAKRVELPAQLAVGGR